MSAFALGIDVGGTKIAAAIVALASGTVMHKRVLPTDPQRGGQGLLDTVLHLATELMDEAGAHGLTVEAIGLGVRELVDIDGNVTSESLIGWRGLDVRGQLSRLAPAVVDSDVRVAALGEAEFGAGMGVRLFVYVTVGTGVSFCLVQDGIPYAGARGNALVFASSPFTTICTCCGAVLKPVIENLASGPGLLLRYNAGSPKPVRSAAEVLHAADAGNELAREIVRSSAQALGVGVAFLVNSLDPQVVIMGGGLGLAGGLYWDHLLQVTRKHIWADDCRHLPIIQAGLGENAGIVGAALCSRRTTGEFKPHKEGRGCEQYS